jgi:hypothetical protein
MSESTPDFIDGRSRVYGDPVVTYSRIAQMWSALLDHEVQPWQVPLMMMALKMIRATQTPDYVDNIKDVEGYADIFRRIIGPDMVDASTVSEYLEELSRRG